MLKKMVGVVALSSMAALAWMPQSASAAVINGACALSDMTFRGNNADACAGSDVTAQYGQNNNQIDTGVTALFGSGWTSLIDDQAGGSSTSGSFAGINFTLAASTGTNSNWTLSWTDNNTNTLPIYLDFVAVIKAATGWEGFMFDEELLQDVPNSGAGTFNITWLNNGNQTPNLSHLELYVRQGATRPNCTLTQTCEERIPEPAPLALMGLGLMGMLLARRRIAA